MVNPTTTTSTAMKKIATALRIPTLVQDTLGAAALLAMLYAGLWMPAVL